MPVIQTGAAETAIYLKREADAIQREMLVLWDEHSGAPGLLTAVSGPARVRTGFSYNPTIDAYTRAGKGKVTDRELRTYVQNVSSESRLRMRKSTQQLIAGLLLYSAWYEQMRSEMAALYRTIWVLSIGGLAFQDDTERNLFYLFVLSQFHWLDNFYYQLEHGIQPRDGTAMQRAGLYGAFGNGLWQNIRLERAITYGFTEAKRLLGPTEDHCRNSADRPGCWELAQKGWLPIGQTTPIGSAVCYSSCLCRFIYQ